MHFNFHKSRLHIKNLHVQVALISNKYRVTLSVSAYLEGKGLVEDGIERFLVHLCVKLLLFVREDENFDIGIRGATAVHGEEIRRLQDSHSQLGWREGRDVC